MKVAVINSGSSSIKYEVFNGEDLSMVATGLIEQIGSARSRLKQRLLRADGSFDEKVHSAFLANHREAFAFMADVNRDDRIVKDDAELIGIGHRVVHGGELFREPVVIDADVIAAIRRLTPLAPLHNPSNILGIEAAQKRFPRVPQVAVFDTAFHQTLPPFAYRYAVPQELYEKQQVRKYGFHGSSHAYVTKEAAKHLGRKPADVNLITLHLGSGASVSAVQGGRSVDTSLGMTPLEGLIMGTRCGDLDPSIPFYLMREAGMTAQQVEDLLNRKSGLAGICGVSDMREILERAGKGDEQARLAVDMFCYRVRKYIGAYYAVLGRVDAIVFTGGIGEHAAPVREGVCAGLGHIGIGVDAGKNAAVSTDIAEIQPDGLSVKVLVIRTDEEREIAAQTIATIGSANGGQHAPAAPSAGGAGTGRADNAVYSAEETLRNGRRLTIRAIRPGDKDALAGTLRELSSESFYRRTFSPKRELNEADLSGLTNVDFRNVVALVAVMEEEGKDRIVGGGRYVLAGAVGEAREAEVAFLIDDDHQGMGIGSRIFRHLIAIARASGISHFAAEVLPSNDGMLRLFARSGLHVEKTMTRDSVHVMIELNAERRT